MSPIRLEGIEIRRKIIHLATLIIPIGYSLTSKEIVLSFLIPFFIFYLSIDVLRKFHQGLASIFKKYFLGRVLREKEASSFMGSTYFLFSAILAIILFPKDIAIVSILFLIISDTIAAFVGKLFGKISIFGKTLEGSIAFFVASLFIILVYPNINIFQGLIGAVSATIIEILPIKLDDNLTIPLVSGAIMLFAVG
jgi:dolichol kinase